MISRLITTPVVRRVACPRVHSCLLFNSVRSLSGTPAKDSIVLNKVDGTSSSLKDDKPNKDPVKIEACGDLNDNDDDDEMEKEQMFVEPHESFQFRVKEWGGPRRGGRLPEPTRYGDWERKGRASDF